MEYKPLFNFSGGMNRKAAPLIIKDEECELAINYHLDTVGALTKRKGYSLVNDQPVSGVAVRGLHHSFSANDYLMVVNDDASSPTNSIIYYDNVLDAAWNAGHSTDSDLSDDAPTVHVFERVFFTDFVDKVFRVNGAGAMLASSDGATFSSTDCLQNESPRYITVFQDRVYAAMDDSVGKRSRVWYSSLPDASFNLTWDETAEGQWFDVNPDDGDIITGLANNGNRLLIFKRNAMYRWTFGLTEADRLIGVGAANQAVIATNFDVGITFFANSYGVYAYSGNRPRLVSRKIQPIIDSITDDQWRESCGGVDEDHYYLSVGDITVDGRTVSNAVLVYHISLDAWTIYSFANKPTIFANVPDDNDDHKQILLFGADNGKVYRMKDGYADESSAVATYFRSKEYLISMPNTSDVSMIDVVADNPGSTQVFIDLDRKDDFYQMGQLDGRITNLSTGRVRKGNTMRFAFSENSTTPSRIDGVNIHYENETRTDAVKKRTRGHENR